jgi:hypothetical protein
VVGAIYDEAFESESENFLKGKFGPGWFRVCNYWIAIAVTFGFRD